MPKKKKTSQSKLTFEQAIERLEAIVDRLEGGEESLEECIKLFEEATDLAKFCQEQLKLAEGNIEKLVDEEA